MVRLQSTHINLTSFLLNTDKQCIMQHLGRVSNFCLQNVIKQLNKNEKYNPTTLKRENFIWLKWVKDIFLVDFMSNSPCINLAVMGRVG